MKCFHDPTLFYNSIYSVYIYIYIYIYIVFIAYFEGKCHYLSVHCNLWTQWPLIGVPHQVLPNTATLTQPIGTIGWDCLPSWPMGKEELCTGTCQYVYNTISLSNTAGLETTPFIFKILCLTSTYSVWHFCISQCFSPQHNYTWVILHSKKNAGWF